ncbi:hypothetical protein SBY92_004319 [Candida maltosa Xu316]
MSLDSILTEIIPSNDGFENIYFQTNPTYVNSPIHIPRSTTSSTLEKPDTVKIRHFYALLHNDLIILGLEVFVYLQIYNDHTDKLIYVSKCDTTGLEKLPFKIGQIIAPVLNYMIHYNNYKIKPRKEKSNEPPSNPSTYFRIKNLSSKLPEIYPTLKYYSTPVEDKQGNDDDSNYRKLPPLQKSKLYIFTRPAREYLFPNSSANELKHMISGAQLLNWWLGVVDKITNDNWEKKILVPGLDARTFTKKYQNWSIGHIFERTVKAIDAIPLFPDDPKGRFLEQLVVDNRAGKMSIDRFFTELPYRQEFMGDLVGIIGCSYNNTTEVVNDGDQNVKLISIRDYKEFVNNLKSIDFTQIDDIKKFIVNYKNS